MSEREVTAGVNSNYGYRVLHACRYLSIKIIFIYIFNFTTKITPTGVSVYYVSKIHVVYDNDGMNGVP